jgi:hypothetical protein
MAAQYLADVARQMIAEQGNEAGEHLAEAIRALRAVGDTRGARLLQNIAQQVEQLEGSGAQQMRRRTMIRRH